MINIQYLKTKGKKLDFQISGKRLIDANGVLILLLLPWWRFKIIPWMRRVANDSKTRGASENYDAI